MDAVVGNGRMLGTLDRRGQLHRLWWPRPDHAQHVRRFWIGLRLNGQHGVRWLHGNEWKHRQAWEGDTAVLKTEAVMPGSLRVTCTDFVVPGCSVMVRAYRIINEGESPLQADFLLLSSFEMGELKRYNTTRFDREREALVHFRNEFAAAVGADRPVSGFQAGRATEAAESGKPDGTEIDMSPEGVLSWDTGLLNPGETWEITLWISFGDHPEAALLELDGARRTGRSTLLAQTTGWWEEYLKEAKPVSTGHETVDRLYRRSLIVFRLMTDLTQGSMIAAPEFDEDFSRCGGYAYCWGRDAAWIATAIDRAGYREMVRDFYRWTVRAQSPDGSWEQRHYLDGRPAPQWGLQIDETGSILWGMWEFVRKEENDGFLGEIWPAVRKGAEFLASFLDPETGLPLPSKDLWEERDGEHTYSAAAVCGGLRAAAQMADRLGFDGLAREWKQAAETVRSAVLKRLWNEKRNAFFRGLKRAVDARAAREAEAKGRRVIRERDGKGYVVWRLWEDDVIDASLLGVSLPFELIPADDPRMVATSEAVETLLSSPVGGIRRYEDDRYIGGNPWILTTLWLAMIRIRQSRANEAVRLLEWAVRHRTALDLLPEQVDRHTGETAWVVPLTWSHAMLVLTVHELVDAGVSLDALTVDGAE